jgi:LemA protein
MTLLMILVALVGCTVFFLTKSYNSLVALQNHLKSDFTPIDVQLKRRYDLIPKIVETAKGYLLHERTTLEAVIAARNQASSAGQQAALNPEKKQALCSLMDAEGTLQVVMTRFMTHAVSSSDLNRNENMIKLKAELTSNENEIVSVLQCYNAKVASYNIQRNAFPGILISGLFGFPDAALFQIKIESGKEI